MTTLQSQELGKGTYRLHADDREIGWASGAAIGFRGFPSARAAVQAAAAAYDALAVWLARQRRADAAPRTPDVLGRRERGQHTELTLGDVPIGWVMPVGGADDEPATEFAFELRLPASVDPALVHGAARAVHAALDRRACIWRLAGRRPASIEAITVG